MISAPNHTTLRGSLPMQVGSNLVGLTSTDGMALSTTRLKEGSTLFRVTFTINSQPASCVRRVQDE
jgi:hypothetical protein